MVPSIAVASVRPSGLNATAAAGLPAADWPPGVPAAIGAPTRCPVATLHKAVVPFPPTVTKVLPPGLNASAFRIDLPEMGRATAIPVGCWVARFHTRALPSEPIAATSLPSGLNAAGPAAAVAAVASAAGSGPPTRCPVTVDHSRRPSAVTARVLPSGLSASPVTAWWLTTGRPTSRPVRAFRSRTVPPLPLTARISPRALSAASAYPPTAAADSGVPAMTGAEDW